MVDESSPPQGKMEPPLDDGFRLAIDTIPALVWTSMPNGYIDFLNQRWCEYTGLAMEDAIGWGWQSAVCPDDLSGLLRTWGEVLRSGQPGEAVARLRRADGQDRWFLFRAIPLYDTDGVLIKWYGQTTDIEERTRAESLLSGERQLFEMIAKGMKLSTILDALCRLAEQMASTSMASILLLDSTGERLGHGAAPSLPVAFTQAIIGASVGRDIGPCASAAYDLERILVPDLESEQRWAGFRRLASTFGLRSCWSNPIVSQDGKLLGTFAIYSREPGMPSIAQSNIMEQMVSLASIAVDRAQAEDALRRSEAYQSKAQHLSRTGSFSWHVASGDVTWSDETYRIFGYDRSVRPHVSLARQRAHPDDVMLFDGVVAKAAADGADFAYSHRLLMPDGTVKYIRVVASAFRDETDQVTEYVGAVCDITERQRAERLLRRARIRGIKTRYAAMIEERTRLAREIHDTLLQGFNGVTLMLLAAAGKVDHPPEAVAALRHVLDLAQSTLGDARRAVWDLRTPSESQDFNTALRLAAEESVRATGLVLKFQVRGRAVAVDTKAQEVAMRVTQEAIANTIKHAGASRVTVCLSYRVHDVRLVVRDDGCGFAVDPAFRAYDGHWGLLGMWERANQIGARLRVRSSAERGTEIVLGLRLPISRDAGSPVA